MANEITLPEETLMRLGFEILDYIYGELTIGNSMFSDELFVDKDGVGRLGYDKRVPQKGGVLTYLYKDRELFLNIIPVEVVDYQRALMAWMSERYNREVNTTWLWK